jgi:thymidylate synthase (FAD)
MSKVELLTYTPNPEAVVAMAMRRCYSTATMDTIEMEVRDGGSEYVTRLITQAHKEGSADVFEHVSFTFHVADISRAASLQLFRHRLVARDLSPDQESQRFSKKPEVGRLVVPKSIEECVECTEDYHSLNVYAHNLVDQMRLHNHPKQDARYALLEGTASNLVLTLNARALLDVAALRLDKRAQWEIREMVQQMVNEAGLVAPAIFKEQME